MQPAVLRNSALKTRCPGFNIIRGASFAGGMTHPHHVRQLRLVLIVLLLAAAVVAGFRIWQLESARRALKSDLKELGHVTYGLFNVDEWMNIASRVIDLKIDQLEVTDENRAELKEELVQLMRALLDEVDDTMDANRTGGLKGGVRKAAYNLIVDMDALKADVPKYADRLLDELNKPASLDRIRGLLHREFCKMALTTSSAADYAARRRIMEREGIQEISRLQASLQERHVLLRESSRNTMLLLIAAMVALVLLVLMAAQHHTLELHLLTAGAIVLLFLGVSLPMIDIEAGIGCFSLRLLGEEVCFKDQVLYYQSKSILEVVQVMMTDRDPGLMLIGVLVLLFSVLLPLAKLMATLRVLVKKAPPVSAMGSFLVYRSGKWSMADVLVVAMFMTYLGFNGIVDSQLAQIQMQNEGTELLTTNGSALQTGFYIFLTYCLMGLVISSSVYRKFAKEHVNG